MSSEAFIIKTEEERRTNLTAIFKRELKDK